MKLLTAIVFMMIFTAVACCEEKNGIDWMTDYQNALKISAEKNLPIFMNFSGSDWCSWCIKLEKEILSRKEFADWATSRFVFMSVDFPKNKPQSEELKKQNKELSKKFGVNGLPTVKIINSSEKVLVSTGYMNNHTPEMYINHLETQLASVSTMEISSTAEATGWVTDFEKAKTLAAEMNLPIMADFSGSDWCSWCKKLDKEVFSQQVFLDWAKGHVIMLLVDFPENTQLPADQVAANEALLKQFKVDGFPTVILLDSEGKEKARTGYQKGGPEKYIKHLESLLSK